MNYMGGKMRQGKQIARFANIVLTKDMTYVEPFCGAMGSAIAVNHSKMILSDVSESLINMWESFTKGLDSPK